MDISLDSFGLAIKPINFCDIPRSKTFYMDGMRKRINSFLFYLSTGRYDSNNQDNRKNEKTGRALASKARARERQESLSDGLDRACL